MLISGARRGPTPALAKLLRRRSSIEPEIGHMKTDGRLARCALKGALGDALLAVLCGCGRKIRKILARLRAHLRAIGALMLTISIATRDGKIPAPPPDRNVQSEPCAAHLHARA